MLSQQQKTLLIRAISSLTAAIVVFAIYYFFAAKGFQFLCLFVVILGGRELIRLLFKMDDLRLLKIIFFIFALCIFLISALRPVKSELGFTLFTLVFCSISLIYEESFVDLSALLLFQAKSVLGFFYLALLPSFAFRLLNLPHGSLWFLMMLIVVFSGDILAYLTGMLLGKNPLMPSISPKKTIEGALGGLLGSTLAACLFCFAFPMSSIFVFFTIGLSVSIVAQLGDLFESLLKRVADIKDSGSLMPGHGGVLDRLDGVLFAAPVVFFFAEWLDKIVS